MKQTSSLLIVLLLVSFSHDGFGQTHEPSLWIKRKKIQTLVLQEGNYLNTYEFDEHGALLLEKVDGTEMRATERVISYYQNKPLTNILRSKITTEGCQVDEYKREYNDQGEIAFKSYVRYDLNFQSNERSKLDSSSYEYLYTSGLVRMKFSRYMDMKSSNDTTSIPHVREDFRYLGAFGNDSLTITVNPRTGDTNAIINYEYKEGKLFRYTHMGRTISPVMRIISSSRIEIREFEYFHIGQVLSSKKTTILEGQYGQEIQTSCRVYHYYRNGFTKRINTIDVNGIVDKDHRRPRAEYGRWSYKGRIREIRKAKDKLEISYF